ncbi:MAG: sensor histidine kinase [Bryobacteraceae bacterium]
MRGERGEIEQWLGACSDIDELKRTETALRYSNDELSQFAHAAAHDLQEPLRNVANAAGLLRRYCGNRLDPEERDLSQACIEGSQRMQSMVRDLLAYAKVIDCSESEAVVTDSSETIQQVLANLGAAIEESKAELNWEPLPVLPVKKAHLLALLQNLIANAIKYRKSDIAPVIRVWVARQGGEWVFSVSDNGIGFDPAYAERIFGVFKRLHQRNEYSGTGIGLAICARIIAHYGGRIWAESQLGEGATFRFTLPAHQTSQRRTAYASSYYPHVAR